MSRTESVLALVGGLFLFGALVIAAFGSWSSQGRRELWRNLADTAGIAAAVLVPAAIHPSLFAAVAAAAGCRCAFELAAIHGMHFSRWTLAMLALLLACAAWVGASATSLAFLVLSTLIVLAAAPIYYRALRGSVERGQLSVLASALPVLGVVHLSHLAHLQDGFLWIFFLYVTVEVQDSMAFLFGRLFGRKLLAPRLSPRKTVAGALAGWLSGLAVGGTIAFAFLDQPPVRALALSALVVAAGFAGDLLASGLKRAAGVKDFPPVTARHGGLLDVYDSTLAAAVPLGAALGLLALTR